MNELYVKRFSAPPIDRDEIIRYCGGAEKESIAFIDEVSKTLSEKLCYKVCYRLTDVKYLADERLDLGYFKTDSKALKRNLNGAEKAILFAATVGLEVERAVNKYAVLSPTAALIADAVGTERIEALCDLACAHFKTLYGELRPRFSPGYGDLSLKVQKDLFSALDCPRSIGLTLNESLLMSPQKSVTAIVGILLPTRDDGKRSKAVSKCRSCENRNCAYREESKASSQ